MNNELAVQAKRPELSFPESKKKPGRHGGLPVIPELGLGLGSLEQAE